MAKSAFLPDEEHTAPEFMEELRLAREQLTVHRAEIDRELGRERAALIEARNAEHRAKFVALDLGYHGSVDVPRVRFDEICGFVGADAAVDMARKLLIVLLDEYEIQLYRDCDYSGYC